MVTEGDPLLRQWDLYDYRTRALLVQGLNERSRGGWKVFLITPSSPTGPFAVIFWRTYDAMTTYEWRRGSNRMVVTAAIDINEEDDPGAWASKRVDSRRPVGLDATL